jgi:hypothetical protein
MGCVVTDLDRGPRAVTVAALQNQINKHKFMTVEWHSIRAELFVPMVGFQDEILRRAVWKPLANARIKVTTAEDLVILKMVFHRQKDLLDVRSILHVQGAELDLVYVRRQAGMVLDGFTVQELESLIKSHVGDS